jgi:hypothetical protein
MLQAVSLDLPSKMPLSRVPRHLQYQAVHVGHSLLLPVHTPFDGHFSGGNEKMS